LLPGNTVTGDRLQFKMKVVEFLFQTVPLIIQLYADQYLRDDLANTLRELEEDSNLPRIKTYDFIVGK
jgi:hypothetical protein